MLVLPLIASAPWAACATAPRAGSAAADKAELERTNLELRARNAGYVRRMEEQENRIFLLEDQLESRKLAAEQRPSAMLPTRVLRADSPSRASVSLASASSGGLPPIRDDGSGVVETTIFAEHPVDYAGEAAQPMASSVQKRSSTRRRSVLRLSTRKIDAAETASASESVPEYRHSSTTGGTTGGRLKLYREALQTLRSGHPDVALEGFRRFLDENPQHDFADNAQYWIGECLYDQRQFPAAERAFRRVVEQFPRGNKVPDAMFKLALTLQARGDNQSGRAVLESLARAFPKHEAARLAAARLAHPEPEPADRPSASTFGTILPAVPLPSAARGTKGGATIGGVGP